MQEFFAGLARLFGSRPVLPPAQSAGTVGLRRDFGAIGDGVTDDTAAFARFLDACRTRRGHIERGQYRIARRPPALSEAVSLFGDGIDVSILVRDYDEAAGRGFLHFRGVPSGAGSRLADFTIQSAAGRTGGHAFCAISIPGKVCGNMTLSHVKFSTLGIDSWDSTVLVDGLANREGAKGVREIAFSSCLIFGAAGFSMVLRGAIGVSLIGGGVYAAGGTPPFSGGVEITGAPDLHSSGITIIADHLGFLKLSHLTGAKILVASGIAGSVVDGDQVAISADETVDLVQVFAEPFGSLETRWRRSSVMRPDGTILNAQQPNRGNGTGAK
jgi:hypothetical protein